MIEYIINKRDFVQCDADIILSGCLDILPPPKLYFGDDVVFWVYPSIEQPLDIRQYSVEKIEDVQNKVSEYLLDPERIVFHPSRIEQEDNQYYYHYVPSRKSVVLYSSEDLAIALNTQSGIGRIGTDEPKKSGDSNIMGLYFKDEERYEKLLLKQNVIGRTIKCNILVDFDGSANIDKNGILSTESPLVVVNGKPVEHSIQLRKGDEIKFGDNSALYW